MADRIALFDHALFVDRERFGRWRVEVWRNTFDEHGIVNGSAHVAELHAVTKLGAIHKGRLTARRQRQRGARWPKPSRSSP